MNRARTDFRVMLAAVSFAMTVSGCIAMSNSPPPRFYMLQTIPDDRFGRKMVMPDNLLIGIGPVKVPEYLDRPQIVTRGKENTLEFAQFDRWGESLMPGIARLLREDLVSQLSGPTIASYPWDASVPVRYQVIIEVVQMDCVLDKDLSLVVQWQLVDLQNTKTIVIRRSEFREPVTPPTYSGLVKAMSTACASLSRAIAEELGALSSLPPQQ